MLKVVSVELRRVRLDDMIKKPHFWVASTSTFVATRNPVKRRISARYILESLPEKINLSDFLLRILECVAMYSTT